MLGARIGVVVLSASLLTGCASGGGFNLVGEDSIKNPFADLKTFVRKDVSAALARAQKATDVGAPYRAECYVELLKHLPEQTAEAPAIAPPVGLVDAFELAAETVATARAGDGLLKIPEGVQARCGYLGDEIRRFTLRNAGKLAPIPGVGAAGGMLFR
jgi:hypothetical protein